MKAEWAIDLKNQCREAGVPFFFKQGFNLTQAEQAELHREGVSDMKVTIGDKVQTDVLGPGRIVAMSEQWCIFRTVAGHEYAVSWNRVTVCIFNPVQKKLKLF